MPTVALACQAMATRFELVLHGGDAASLRAAGEEALSEVERLDAVLSPYWLESEISEVNRRAATEAVRVSPAVFELLRQAGRLHEETSGAFDITVGPLMECWGFWNGSGVMPDRADVAEARERVGFHRVHLDAGRSTVRFEREGVRLDLGAIGKGYAVERACGILRLAGVDSALLHGGTSTVYAIGTPPDADFWNVAIPTDPVQTAEFSPSKSAGASPGARVVSLKDEALSVSAVWGKSFQAAGRRFGHVLDPRTGEPVQGALLAAVVLPSATETDALSTALLILGESGGRLLSGRPAMRWLQVLEEGDGFRVNAGGF